MYYTTGFHGDEIVELAAMVHAVPMVDGKLWPSILGLFKSVVIALTYLRRNRVQCELAETYGVSQATISRAIAVMTPLLAKVLQKYVPTADELDPSRQYVVDGTLLPCWSWASRPELYSGKHKASGVNVQVACTLEGVLVWISDPIDGSRHDTHCLRESGVLLSHGAENWMGDKGYVGNGMLTPIKKPIYRDFLDWEKKFNTQINKVRYVIEQTIADFKTWRILHTDYRRPFETFAETISAVVALHFYALA